MSGKPSDDSLTPEGFEKFIGFIAPVARALEDATPLRDELLARYEIVVADTDWYADQFLDDETKGFMRTLAHSIAARHPDRFMEHRPIKWASAIESMIFLPMVDAIEDMSIRRAMLGACRYTAPGVEKLTRQLGNFFPVPGKPTDPEVIAWFNAMRETHYPETAGTHTLENTGTPSEDAADDEGAGSAERIRITGATDYDDTSVPEGRREFYREIASDTDSFAEILGPTIVMLSHDFVRTALTYGTDAELAWPAEDVALFFDVMILSVIRPPDESVPFEYEEIENGLRRGNEDLLEQMRETLGQAFIRGLAAEGRRKP